jgi:hypothetical protein
LPVLPAGTAVKDGATLPVEISLSPVPTASESFVLVVIRDATETWRRDDLLDLARGAVADQSHLNRDLLDRVAHHLFQVGLSLQAVAGRPRRRRWMSSWLPPDRLWGQVRATGGG